MPSTYSPVLKAADLRLIHAAAKINRVHLRRYAANLEKIPDELLKAVEASEQLFSIVNQQLVTHNIVPALSAQELRDEDIPDYEIPSF